MNQTNKKPDGVTIKKPETRRGPRPETRNHGGQKLETRDHGGQKPETRNQKPRGRHQTAAPEPKQSRVSNVSLTPTHYHAISHSPKTFMTTPPSPPIRLPQGPRGTPSRLPRHQDVSSAGAAEHTPTLLQINHARILMPKGLDSSFTNNTNRLWPNVRVIDATGTMELRMR